MLSRAIESYGLKVCAELLSDQPRATESYGEPWRATESYVELWVKNLISKFIRSRSEIIWFTSSSSTNDSLMADCLGGITAEDVNLVVVASKLIASLFVRLKNYFEIK